MASYGDERDLLEFSSFYDVPENYPFFNCYSYAINQTQGWYDPGYFIDVDYDVSWELQDFADYTFLDLSEGLDYCVQQYNTMPNLATIPVDSQVIALRIATLFVEDYRDYHFMRLFKEDGNYNWRHKVGGGCILTYNQALSNNIPWNNESVSYNIVAGYGYLLPFTTYDSDIVYFVFRPLHRYGAGVYTGNSSHGIGVFENIHYDEYRKVCSDCGDVVVYYESRECTGICLIRPIDPGIVVDGVGGEQNEEN